MSLTRGDIHEYGQPGAARQRIVLLVANQAVLDSERPWFNALDLVPDTDGDILTVPIPGHGWVNTVAMLRVYRPWIRERIGTTDADTIEKVEIGLRTANAL
ncbi:hypothetical protein JK358_06095 [Nocardia sp. 2]|uniref:Uncharacterized protein n=1 Tax=Nocardia acididurans TaxID=2802282 RepID=A0ABS1M171_9NOCA|nr:hypothetical protein [Nocardia acididurans]MBL1073960.1 hypothetical protein [Nocardia acididurans]